MDNSSIGIMKFPEWKNMWVWVNIYENTIFSGMNIHFIPAILMWTTEVLLVLTHCHMCLMVETPMKMINDGYVSYEISPNDVLLPWRSDISSSNIRRSCSLWKLEGQPLSFRKWEKPIARRCLKRSRRQVSNGCWKNTPWAARHKYGAGTNRN